MHEELYMSKRHQEERVNVILLLSQMALQSDVRILKTPPVQEPTAKVIKSSADQRTVGFHKYTEM